MNDASLSHPSQDLWPDLPTAAWRDTAETLQLWTQIVGKIRLSRTPWLNHSWHVTLYVTARGLTTSPIPDDAGNFSSTSTSSIMSCEYPPVAAQKWKLALA